VEAIARGRATAYVFDTYADMNRMLAVSENGRAARYRRYSLHQGHRRKGLLVGRSAPQQLEAESPDLTDYYTKAQVDAMMPITITRTDYDALVAAGNSRSGSGILHHRGLGYGKI
jgi:hypothetical protein